ncbi:MAG: FKBP-type peptidyl-prolyl cis-trans isomerase [Candidatus Eremiobacteraeota bacterium]|nr:FKBP-type peptidyl-prolyl cis-trans isomerase [Candidatus Eremiobacteraeota bacterium]
MHRSSFLTSLAFAVVAAPLALRSAGIAATSKIVKLAGGETYVDLRAGSGPAAKAGDNVRVHYVGTLANGTKFDSSRDRGVPFDFSLGSGQVIRGWDEGVAGMRVGEVRKLVVPAALGYGDQGAGDKIPPNATLVFTIELLAINPAS